jgi:iron complex outermembrane receptor protein
MKQQAVLWGILFCLFSNAVFAQQKPLYKLSCTVKVPENLELESYTIQVFDTEMSLKKESIGAADFLLPNGVYFIEVLAPGFRHDRLRVFLEKDYAVEIVLQENVLDRQNHTVKAIQVREKNGYAFTPVTAKQLSRINLGQDFTYLIGNTPSALTTSDAGSGVGYTGIRIRGSDATRINVTINGIPINDAESHGVFWVNMPDLASSTSSVQIQRGAGSSTLGSGAFGANINIQNLNQSALPFLQLQQSIGSFNTFKSTLQFGTGKLGNFNFSGRLSKINSDGYIDRAASDLKAFQFNLSYTQKTWSITALSFGGKEKTYQSWYGTPESRIKNDVQGMNDYADRNYLSAADRDNLLNSGRTYNYYNYKNQTDNYWQNHYQLHLFKTINQKLNFKSSFFTSTGKGFYEECKSDAAFAKYGVANFTNNTDTILSTDLVRQRWLDNIYYGNFSSLNYKNNKTDFIAGISISQYDGKHHGDVIWASIAQPFGKDFRYYQSKSKKTELNTFAKLNYRFSPKLQADAEFQVRNIQYSGSGNDNDLKAIQFDVNYLFMNPKLAMVYEFNSKSRVYSSFSVANREPVRSDIIDNSKTEQPKSENLKDLELGYIIKEKLKMFQFNFYNMQYANQLVLTGELNDVGSSLRRNVKNSYRRGIELIVQYPLIQKTKFNLSLDANLNLSANKIKAFEDVYYNYDSNTVVKDLYKNTDIAYSPNAIGFLGLNFYHQSNLDLQTNVKYVGPQYLDNTSNASRKLEAYYTVNMALQKTFNLKNQSQLVIKALLNNMNGIFYSNNGYTYKYVYSGKLITENFYYPQSRINFMFGLDFKFL